MAGGREKTGERDPFFEIVIGWENKKEERGLKKLPCIVN